MSAVAATPEPSWNEREYNPRLLVPHAAEIYGRWAERAAETRQRYEPETIRYGEHPREVYDLFRAPYARGTVVFIHGGYWRAFSKDESSWIAEGFAGQNVSTVILNYPLCPDVALGQIAESARAAFAHLWRETLSRAERARIVVSGHSAGAYLSALHLATDWTAHGLPADPIAGIVPISGVFELAPLLSTSMNDGIRLDATSAAALSLVDKPPLSHARAAFVVGGDESAEFHRQSDAMAAHWAALGPQVIDLPGLNHFDVIDGLAEPGSALNRLVLDMLDGTPRA